MSPSPPPHYPQDPDEEVDNIHIERGGAVYGVVDGLRDAVGPAPVVADVAAEDGNDGPVQNVVVHTEDEDLNELDNDNGNQRQEECASDF